MLQIGRRKEPSLHAVSAATVEVFSLARATNTLDLALDQFVKRDDAAVAVGGNYSEPKLGWKIIRLFCWITIILTFLAVMIVPTFAQMFKGFGLDLPAPTVFLISAMAAFADYWFLMFPPAILMIAMILAIRANRWLGHRVLDRVMLRRRRAKQLGWLRPVMDRTSFISTFGSGHVARGIIVTGFDTLAVEVDRSRRCCRNFAGSMLPRSRRRVPAELLVVRKQQPSSVWPTFSTREIVVVHSINQRCGQRCGVKVARIQNERALGCGMPPADGRQPSGLRLGSLC